MQVSVFSSDCAFMFLILLDEFKEKEKGMDARPLENCAKKAFAIPHSVTDSLSHPRTFEYVFVGILLFWNNV